MSPLHPVVFEKFNRAFGKPKHDFGKDRHWSLHAHDHHAPINVLVNGSNEHPVVWVFDPHDLNDGVSHQRISTESEIDQLIGKIQQRVKAAERPRGPGAR